MAVSTQFLPTRFTIVELLIKPTASSTVAMNHVISWADTNNVKYFSAGGPILDTMIDVYVNNTGTQINLDTILLSANAGDVMTVVWTDSSNVIQTYLVWKYSVASNSTVEILEGIKLLPVGHKIRAQAGTSMSIVVGGKSA